MIERGVAGAEVERLRQPKGLRTPADVGCRMSDVGGYRRMLSASSIVHAVAEGEVTLTTSVVLEMDK